MKMLMVGLFLTMACNPASDGGSDGSAVDAPAADDGLARVDAETADLDARDGDDVSHHVSGERIKARIGTTPGGARALLGWRDTLLDANCSFQGVGVGVRCFPTAIAQFANTYSDASCTVPIAVYPRVNECLGGPPSYAGEYEPSCSNLGAFYTYYSIVATTPTDLYHVSGANCVLSSSRPNANESYFTVGAEVPLSSFASATESLE